MSGWPWWGITLFLAGEGLLIYASCAAADWLGARLWGRGRPDE